ncbi:hypothetical protein [Wenzhouxiangella marina]|uniref:Uncharacterized protein n=1 Tax=Wenzhouxiangella marina TaxID=1579979 RepID=A0A0K0XYK2_9GAMM|nr:hypothetical protein [Wenzhouxiangella marina]AKS42702.1 hypothetical protein WM2015_2339 [Wenzhouxiangella marina]MBB6088609.1 hypothetical protein [Wenzhouxiangella marina]
MNAAAILKAGLAILLAWVPALFWLVFAGTGVIMGVGGLFSSEPWGGLVFIALGLGGILGFIGLTLACWTRWPMTRTRAIFLACGVISLLVAMAFLTIEGDRGSADPETILKVVYFVVCPVVFALHLIWKFLTGRDAGNLAS